MKEQDQKPEPRTLRQEQDKIVSQNRFRPPTPDKDTDNKEYQTDETESSIEYLQTLNRRYQEERMAATAAAVERQNQNQKVPNPKEIRINLPKEFSGLQSEAGPFLQDVTLYLTLNQEVYNNDNKKIIFTLSFMNSSPA